MPTDELLRLDEAATLLRVDQRTLRRYIRGRGLPAIRLPGRVLIRRRDLDQWLETRRSEGGSRTDAHAQ